MFWFMPAYHDGKRCLKPRPDSAVAAAALTASPLCAGLQKHGASTVYTKHNKVE